LDTGLGIERSDDVVLVEITHQGRDEAQKQALYRRLAELLSNRGLATPEDLIVAVSENRPADPSATDERSSSRASCSSTPTGPPDSSARSALGKRPDCH
jgi:phenylpyruvate tautomerase PptA (4-oxalocrotonate tautomerase family)